MRCTSGNLVLMAGSTMPDWSAGEGQTKQHPGPPGWGLGMSPPFSTFKTRLATEIPTRELQEIPYLGEEGSSVRRRVKSSGESLRYLEATGWNWLSLSQRHHQRNTEPEDHVFKWEGCTSRSRGAT